jgi:hypothetical protein
MSSAENPLATMNNEINKNVERPLETRRELAKRYSVSERTIANWMRSGLIPFLAISARTIRFDPSEVDAAVVRNHRVASRREVPMAA